MDRDVLVELLDQDTEAFRACREAVAAGAEFVIWDGTAETSALASIYARRERHTRRIGLPTLGFPEAVTRLRDHREPRLTLGQVRAEDPPFHFQLFLDQAATEVIACPGVDRDPAHRTGRT